MFCKIVIGATLALYLLRFRSGKSTVYCIIFLQYLPSTPASFLIAISPCSGLANICIPTTLDAPFFITVGQIQDNDGSNNHYRKNNSNYPYISDFFTLELLRLWTTLFPAVIGRPS